MPVRPARDDDLPEMHRIRMSVRENVLSDPQSVQLHDYRAMLTAGGLGWVFESAGVLLGFAIADVRRSNVWALFVDPEHEGRGIGRALHHAMLDGYFATGAQRLWLGTEPGTRADRFYARAGWRSTGLHGNGERGYEIAAREWDALRSVSR